MQLLSVIVLILMVVPVSISLAFMPHLSRETVSFGVTVSEENFRSEPLRRMRKSYTTISLIIYTILFAVGLFGLINTEGNAQGFIFGGLVVAMILVSTILNLVFHSRMKKLKETLPSAPAKTAKLAFDTGFRRNKLIMSFGWFLIHAAIIVVSTVAVLMNYDKISDPVAMKFDFQGNIVNTADKSYWIVLFPNIMQVLITLLFMFVNWSIKSSKQQLHAGDPERSIRQNTLFRRRWSMFTVLSGIAMVLLFSFIQINMFNPFDTEIIFLVSLIIPALIVLFAIVLSFTTGQGGSRIGRTEQGSQAQPVNDDAHWKLGSIYYNPQDPSIFVEKRVGVGWTLNFAHPAGWMTLLGILAAIVITAIFTG